MRGVFTEYERMKIKERFSLGGLIGLGLELVEYPNKIRIKGRSDITVFVFVFLHHSVNRL
jgi:hypothetical protein